MAAADAAPCISPGPGRDCVSGLGADAEGPGQKDGCSGIYVAAVSVYTWRVII